MSTRENLHAVKMKQELIFNTIDNKENFRAVKMKQEVIFNTIGQFEKVQTNIFTRAWEFKIYFL